MARDDSPRAQSVSLQAASAASAIAVRGYSDEGLEFARRWRQGGRERAFARAGVGATAAKGHMPFAGHLSCAEA